MKIYKYLLIGIAIFQIIVLSQHKAVAQHSEVGMKLIISGAIMFGPYYSCWFDDHQELNASILAAYAEGGKLFFPFAFNAGYSVHFLDNKWRPQIGIQYSFLKSPVKERHEDEPIGISVLSLVPGGEFRWDNTKQNVQSKIWLAYLFTKPRQEKIRILPIALDFSYGYKFN